MTRARQLLSAMCIVATSAIPAAAQSVRQPYLQLGTEDGMSIAWRTAVSGDSVVCWGSAPAALTNRATGAIGLDHVVRISGLAPATLYYYAVSTSGTCPVAGDAGHHFRTSPAVGDRSPFRFWVLGDSGTGDSAQRAVFSAMQSEVGTDVPDLFLHMGDIAYDAGTTAEFDANFFAVYESVLANTPCWPTLGNHEGMNSDSATQTGPYYTAYVLPSDGSAGGLSSGTEAYYAFDYGNVHFVVLDSQDSPRTVGGPMLSWLESDLASTDQEWVLAYWHHPPYTDGTHTDTETQLREMRENVLPILEAAAVDLVLGGHSHIYERSHLLHGLYTIIDPGDGRLGGDGPYEATGDGTVYVVAGHGGAGVGGTGMHPMMATTEIANGSCIVDVNGPALTLRNIRSDGVETDDFTMLHGSSDGIVLLSPNGGETYLAGSTVDIVWASNATSGDVRLEYSVDDGRTWRTILDSTPDDGNHAWQTPLVATTLARVRVTDVADAAVSAMSAAPFTLAAESTLEVIPMGGVWAYQDQGVDEGDAWRTALGGWASGPGQLGYGDGDEATLLAMQAPNIPSYYFRREVVVDGAITSAHARVIFDDGFALFVNGTQVLARNVDDVSYGAYATTTSADNDLAEADLDPSAFRAGSNVIAVIVKQAGTTSSDLSFDLSLTLGVRVDVVEEIDAGVSADGGATTDGASADGGPDTVDGGCGCRASGSRGSTMGFLLVFLALVAGFRRRKPGNQESSLFLVSWVPSQSMRSVAALLLLAGCGAVPPATAEQRAQVRVTMYTTSWCPVCTSARTWLSSRGIPFDDYDVEADPSAAARHRSLNPSRTVPTIDVEGRILNGFVAEELRSAVDSAAHRY